MKLFPTPENKAPSGAVCIEVPSKGGIKLRAMYAVPKSPKGTILILNGRAEFIERYFETMNDMMRRGFAVASFDWRGQGGSQRLIANPLRGYINSFADYDADLDAFVARVAVAHCPKPFYVLAHSTGGHILLRALRGRKWAEKAVITGPLLGLHFGAWPPPAAKFLTLAAKGLGMSWAYLPVPSRLPMTREDFPGNPLTSDRKRWDRDMLTLEKHPELGIGGPTYAWLGATMASIDELMNWPAARGPSCPTMIVLAGQDKVVNNKGAEDFLKRAHGFSVLTIPEAQHEILNEQTPIREKFLAAFDAFIGG